MFCDFTLISKDRKSFHCHKIVLASRSPVLKAMLNSGMQEAKKQQLEIKNHESGLLANVLEFMYKGITYSLVSNRTFCLDFILKIFIIRRY